jgi:hypothetical protein
MQSLKHFQSDVVVRQTTVWIADNGSEMVLTQIAVPCTCPELTVAVVTLDPEPFK